MNTNGENILRQVCDNLMNINIEARAQIPDFPDFPNRPWPDDDDEDN
jgi:hypothetical protein